ncbi:hypothetical protein RvY_03987-2 [Ramazzottius varieornatus]|uniref:Uncharacterized protein n=1 Tax=Ramazzottius varieornatus TaxID=947166 RepID=A0A1D1V024_RAMVA|nr:hypothetical protein RvY_03987-2 [Ramazzottius varieornatus]
MEMRVQNSKTRTIPTHRRDLPASNYGSFPTSPAAKPASYNISGPSAVPCHPDTNPAVIGRCLGVADLSSCSGPYASVASSAQCTVSELLPSSGELPDQAMIVAEAMVHRCGVPNGDPGLLTTVQSFELSVTPSSSRRTFVKAGRRGVSVSNVIGKRRMKVADKIVGGREAPNGAGYLYWQVCQQNKIQDYQ